MRTIKQLNQSYAEYVDHWEHLIDVLVHNPLNQKSWEKKLKNGTYYRNIKGVASITQLLFGFRNKDYNFHWIAQSHLDAAWLWPVVDTKVRACKTFKQAVENIENFKFLRVCLTSPQYYDWVKAYMPKLWEKVKEYVAHDRIEISGGMWVEPDLDMPCGESLCRQRLYGMTYFQREFGKMPHVESLLDVFGFTFALPQILKKSGADAFWTTKLTWNSENYWPISSFMWEGVDGTQIFTHNSPFNWQGFVQKLYRYKKTQRIPKPEFKQKKLSTANTNAEIENCFSDDRVHDLGVFYGWGDGGKGPINMEVGAAQVISQLGLGKHTTLEGFMPKLKKAVGDRYLIWNDELYLEFHRGTKTSQLEVKHYNRQAELWITAAEMLQTMVNTFYPEIIPFKKAEIFEMWRKLMFNQFHDILPGSSIADVYLLAIKELKEAILTAKKLVANVFKRVSKTEKEIVIYNPFNWERSEYFAYKHRLLYCEKVPPQCIQVLPIEKLVVNPLKWSPIVETATTYILENELIKVDIRKDFGTLCSLFFKPVQAELINPGLSARGLGGAIRVFHEYPRQFKAWNMDRYYPRRSVSVQLDETPTIIATSDGNQALQVKYKYLHSRTTIIYSVRPKDPLLHVDIRSDNVDKQLLVKYFVPLALQSENVTSDIPYAAITRRRVKHTELEKGKWEMNMQKWVDVSDRDYGLTILNNNRYGFNATSRGVYITLTRTAKHSIANYHNGHRLIRPKDYPTYLDRYPFEFHLGLFPHLGNWQMNNIFQSAMNFNLPLITDEILDDPQVTADLNIPSGSGFIKPLIKVLGESFLQVSAPNILLGAIKPSEFTGANYEKLVAHSEWVWDKKTIILRLVEQSGLNSSTKLSWHKAIEIKKIEEVNILEMNPAPGLVIKDNSCDLEFKPFEIKTLRVTFNPEKRLK